jgi:uncharacterized protein
MRQAIYDSLSLRVSAAVIGCDTIAQLEENVRLAREFTPLNAEGSEKAGPVSKPSPFLRFYGRA